MVDLAVRRFGSCTENLTMCELRVHAGTVHRMVYRYVPVSVYGTYQVRRTRWYKRKCTQVLGTNYLELEGGKLQY